MRRLRAAPRPAARRRRLGAIVPLVLGVLAVGAAAVAIVALVMNSAHAPRELVLAVDKDSRAAHAASAATSSTRAHAAAAYLAEQPTALWLVPERDPIGRVAAHVRSYATAAAAQGATATMVVYGLPDRDCGNFSAGGLTPGEYAQWTGEIGDALRAAPVDTILVLEPDSIALAPECGDMDARAEQLQTAVANLSGERIDIYIDGGHSNWHPVERMAQLIEDMGVLSDVRGFATNVSNYNDDPHEREYAHALSDRLGGTHAVIDTSRNGAGATSDWCNPPGRLVGVVGASYADDVVDTNLWVKAPGESDGECNGGPPAGEWWEQRAIELTRDVVDQR